MRRNLHVGDEIITIGGICGKIVKTKEESIIIQVGAERVKFEMMRWSVSKVVESKEDKNIRKDISDDEEDEPKKSRPKRLEKKVEEPVEVVEEEAGDVAEEAEEIVEEAEEVVEETTEE